MRNSKYLARIFHESGPGVTVGVRPRRSGGSLYTRLSPNWFPSGNLVFMCHSEERSDEESRSSMVRNRFFAEPVLSLSKGSE
jgi:hypothetical protein